MNKALILSILLFASGVIGFYSAIESYRTIQILQQTPIIYDIQAKELISDAVTDASSHLRIAVIISLILGWASWILGIIFIVKRNTILSNK